MSMLERINRIRNVGGDHAADLLETSYNVMLAAKETADKSGKSFDIKDAQSKLAGFEKMISEFESLYKADTFKNLSAVYEYLSEEGYKIAVRTIYQHKDEGKLKPNDSGGYVKKDVDDYAGRWLSRVDNDSSQSEGSLVDQKNEAEIRLKNLRADRERILIDEAMGRLISRENVGREFAARIEEIKRGFEEIESSLPELLEGKTAQEIRGIIRTRLAYFLEQYSRKLEGERL